MGRSQGNNLTITGCANSGKIYGHFAAGGIMGYSDKRDGSQQIIGTCKKFRAITGLTAGGIAGSFESGMVKESENRAEISTEISDNVILGGIAGLGGAVGCSNYGDIVAGSPGQPATSAPCTLGGAEFYAPQGRVKVTCTVPQPFTQRDEKGVEYRYEYTLDTLTAKAVVGAAVPVQSGAELDLTEGLMVDAVFSLSKN